MYHSHSYVDPETGEVIDVMVSDPYDGHAHRNARDHRGDAGGHPGGIRPHTPPWRPGHADRGGVVPGRVIVRHPQNRAEPRSMPSRTEPVPLPASSEFIAIPKSALAELVPALGQVWASFLGRPDAPQAVGNDVIDRNNAAMHRDALATHAQNQTRILALTDLAARALKLML